MVIAEQPLFPLTIRFSDGETEVVENRLDAECNLEWLDSDDSEDPIQVVDAKGRPVRLKIEGLRIQILELLKKDLDGDGSRID